MPIGVSADDLRQRLASRPRETRGIEQVGRIGRLDHPQEVRPGGCLAGSDLGGGPAPALFEDARIPGVEVERLVRRVRVAPGAECKWSMTLAEKVLQSGAVKADADGLLTLPACR